MRPSVRVLLFVLGGLAGCSSSSDGAATPICGDGVIAGGEDCDDGNTTSGDGCSRSCKEEVGWDCTSETCVPVCNDGREVLDEVCDPSVTPGYCSADCSQIIGRCGDGKVQAEVEKCDGGAAGLRGCSECHEEFGFTCSPATNTCTATGLPGDKTCGSLNQDETRKYCEWLINLLGGEGVTWTCGALEIVNNYVSSCTTKMYQNWGTVAPCTIAQVEDWVRSFGDRCTLWNAKSNPSCASNP